MSERFTRRDFMLSVAGLGIAAGGLGVGYKAVTMPEFDYTKPVEATTAPEPITSEESPSTINRGALVITQEERVGNTYLDYIENTYKKFELFKPFSYVVIQNITNVKDGTIKLSKDTLEGTNRSIELPYAFSKSIALGILERGNPREIKPYIELMEYTERISDGYYAKTKEKVFAVLNPYEQVPTTPEDIFASVSTVLYNNIEGVREQVQAMPKELAQEFNYGADSMMFEVDSEELMISKDLIRHTLEVYDKLPDREISDMTKSKHLNELFANVGAFKYQLYGS